MSQTFFIAVALLIGLSLIISSVHLTPLVENSTDRAKQSVIGVQILGVAILSILGTKLTCQGSPRDFDILLSIMLVFVGVAVGLFWVIYTDSVESREFTIYALSISIGIFFTIIGLLIYIFVYKRRKSEPTINYKDYMENSAVWENDSKLEEELKEELDDLLYKHDLENLEEEYRLKALLENQDLEMLPAELLNALLENQDLEIPSAKRIEILNRLRQLRVENGKEVPITFRLPSSEVEVAELKKERQKIAAEIEQIKEERQKINLEEYNKSLEDFKKMQGELLKTTSDKNSAKIRKLSSKIFADSQELAEELENSDT
jgi:hypothetical protein